MPGCWRVSGCQLEAAVSLKQLGSGCDPGDTRDAKPDVKQLADLLPGQGLAPLSETMLLCAARKSTCTKSEAPASEVASRLTDCV